RLNPGVITLSFGTFCRTMTRPLRLQARRNEGAWRCMPEETYRSRIVNLISTPRFVVYGLFVVLAAALVWLWARPESTLDWLPETVRAAVFALGLILFVWGLFPPKPLLETEEKAGRRAALAFGAAAMAGAILISFRPAGNAPATGAEAGRAETPRRAII